MLLQGFRAQGRAVSGHASLANGDDNVALAFAVGAASRRVKFAVEDGIDFVLDEENNHVSITPGIEEQPGRQSLTSGHGPSGPMGAARMGEAIIAAMKRANAFILEKERLGECVEIRFWRGTWQVMVAAVVPVRVVASCRWLCARRISKVARVYKIWEIKGDGSGILTEESTRGAERVK
ncbi:hypothetical protein IF1G_02742 [Cordyceps javanica]|uniref:Uncharacterized protein n=1 Tax=Cordyceps javanica TaxID=43265 RepID=A0A545VAB3_9HYPO|nr:hypothetical protein IF1G_02742 [Cordyceps javanica]